MQYKTAQTGASDAFTKRSTASFRRRRTVSAISPPSACSAHRRNRLPFSAAPEKSGCNSLRSAGRSAFGGKNRPAVHLSLYDPQSAPALLRCGGRYRQGTRSHDKAAFLSAAVCAAVILMGAVSGFPVGASCAASLYLSGRCKKEEAERMLCFCNFCGPPFILGGVAGFLNHSGAGLAIFLAQTAVMFSLGILLGIGARRRSRKSAVSAAGTADKTPQGKISPTKPHTGEGLRRNVSRREESTAVGSPGRRSRHEQRHFEKRHSTRRSAKRKKRNLFRFYFMKR